MNSFVVSNQKTPLESFFRSIGILFESGNNNGLSHDIKHLRTWVAEYDNWYKAKIGILENRNLHLLYARNIHLFINGLLSKINQDFTNFILAIKDLGFVTNLHLNINECIENHRILINIASSIPGISFVINSGDHGTLTHRIQLKTNQVIESLVVRNSSFVITGNYSYWKNSNIFSNRNINKCLYRFRPDGNISSNIKIPNHFLPTPCGPRFRLFVDLNGLLYPCYGLIGFENFTLGTIFESAWNNKLNNKEYRDRLYRWATDSPNLNILIQHDYKVKSLPHICNLHINNIGAVSGTRQDPGGGILNIHKQV